MLVSVYQSVMTFNIMSLNVAEFLNIQFQHCLKTSGFLGSLWTIQFNFKCYLLLANQEQKSNINKLIITCSYLKLYDMMYFVILRLLNFISDGLKF